MKLGNRMVFRCNPYFAVLVVVVISASCRTSQDSTFLDSGEHILPLASLEYLIDSTNQLTIEQLAEPANGYLFSQKSSYQNKDFKSNQTYWIKFKIPENETSSATLRLLEFYDQTIDILVVYSLGKNGDWRISKMGDHLPFYQRTFRHKNFEVVFNPEIEQGIYYFKIKSHGFADIRLAYRTINRFIYYALGEYFLFGIFYGMILIISLYNFLTYLAIGELKFIYYIFYILSVALYAMSLDGIGFQYLWPNQPRWNDYSIGVSLYLVIIWAIIFTRRFLGTKRQAPFLDVVLVCLLFARSLLLLLALTYYKGLLGFQIIDVLPLLIIFYAGIYVWRNGYRPARYFVIAYGVLFFGFFIKSLVYFNLLPFTILSHYSLHLSFVFEMLFLTVALGDRIRILKNNRDRALRRIIQQNEVNMQLKDKVNRELEDKVKERTSELDNKNLALEESNNKLLKQANEINQINSILDLDNWKLKNRVKEVLEERLLEKTMDYWEFKTLFPDVLTCYRLIDELKGQVPYCCRKCSNPKFSIGKSKFSKRCTRCGYNESITSFTIFQGVKIPIEKAFFIAYHTIAARKTLTLDALGKQLEVRVNTVWLFRKKVADKVKELQDFGIKPSASKWEDFILDTPRLKKTGLPSKTLLKK